MAIRDLLAQDVRVKRLNIQAKVLEKQVNLESLSRELFKLHENRLSNKLKRRDVIQKFQSSFITAILQNQATRARVTAIKMQCFDQASYIENDLLVALKRYLSAEYNEQLNRSTSTKAERDALILSLVPRLNKLLAKLNAVVKIADMVLADIDSAGWRESNLIKIVELTRIKSKEI